MDRYSALWLVIAILVICWLLGLGGVYSFGGDRNLIHIILVVVVILVLFNLLSRRPGPP